MRVNVGAPSVACKQRSIRTRECDGDSDRWVSASEAHSLPLGGVMKHIPSVLLVAWATMVAACTEHDGAGRPLGLAAAADSSGDSIPGRKPGPVASVTVSPE